MMSEPIEALGIRAADVVDERGEVLDRVRPPHRRQDAVARVLQRQMKMRREAIGCGNQIHDLSRAVHRLERGDAEEQARSAEAVDATGRVGRPARAAVRSATSAGSRSRPYEPRWTPVSAISLKPAAVTRSTSPKNRVDAHASRCPPRRRDDAVRAGLGAAGLHAEGEGRAPRHAGLDRRAARTITSRRNRGDREDRRAMRFLCDLCALGGSFRTS